MVVVMIMMIEMCVKTSGAYKDENGKPIRFINIESAYFSVVAAAFYSRAVVVANCSRVVVAAIYSNFVRRNVMVTTT